MKKIFWNVDTQYDFMRPMGALYVKDAELIEPNLALLTKYARENNIRIVNTADWHDEKTEEIADKPDFRNTFPRHCMQNTYGAEYIAATQPFMEVLKPEEKGQIINWYDMTMNEDAVRNAKEIILRKDKFDIFEGNRYADKIVELIAPKEAVVYGVATNVCVDRAVQGLLQRGVQVYVPLDAIKELPGLPLEPILENWKAKGAVLTKTKDITDKLE